MSETIPGEVAEEPDNLGILYVDEVHPPEYSLQNGRPHVLLADLIHAALALG